jgi:S-layer homology domain
VASNRFIVGLVAGLLLPLGACANSSVGDSLQRSLAADPRLEESPALGETATSPTTTPDDLTASASPSSDVFASPELPSAATSPDASSAPQPGDRDFIGPVLPESSAAASSPANPQSPSDSAAEGTPIEITDLDQAPPQMRTYIQDLAQLGVFSSKESTFKPNQAITRREFARWLVAANNLIYGDRPTQQIRLGVSSDQPAFQDVPRSDPDFAAIQGLAKAGLIPSPLSGDATTVTFRPDAPLTRENLLLWKVPTDTRQSLPNASVEAVQQSWGFQDAARIDPKALRAVLADYQNGDLSNIRRAFGFTTLFQPKQSVTRAEAAAVLWYFGAQNEGLSAQDKLAPQNGG